MKTNGKTIGHSSQTGIESNYTLQASAPEKAVEVEKTNAPGISDFVCSQETEITETIGQAEVNRQSPKNIASRKLLQGAMLQSNFQRAQGVKQPTASTNAKTEKQEQQEFLESLKDFRYRKDTVEVPEKWAGDVAFLSEIASKNNIGLSGLPEDIRNNKDFLLHYLNVEKGIAFAKDLKGATLQDKEIVSALVRTNGMSYKDLPMNMKKDDDIIDIAMEVSYHNFEDVPQEKRTLDSIKKWVARDKHVLRDYNDFPLEAKEDLGLLLQYIKNESSSHFLFGDIPESLQGNVEVISAFIEHSSQYHDAFVAISPDLKKNQQICETYIKRAKEGLDGYQFQRQRDKQSSKYDSYEQAIHVEKSGVPKELLASIDGSKHGALQSGEKDALVTETEIFAKLEETLTNANEPSAEVAHDVFLMKQLLRYTEVAGVEVRVAGTGKDTAEVTEKREFDAIRLESLEHLVDSSVSSYERNKRDKLIKNANKTDTHAAIPDVFEKAIFGYTTSDYRELNKSLRTGKISEKQQTYIDGIAEGLRQMPSHKGIVWRGTDLPTNIKAQYVPGEEVVEKAFLSTSYGEKPAFSGDTMYCIQLKDKGSAGKKIDHLSDYKDEKEVLLNAGTRFKVLAKEESKKKNSWGEVQDITVIYLQEV